MEQEAAVAPARKVKGRGAKSAGGEESRYAGDAGVFESIDGGSGPGPQRCECAYRTPSSIVTVASVPDFEEALLEIDSTPRKKFIPYFPG